MGTPLVQEEIQTLQDARRVLREVDEERKEKAGRAQQRTEMADNTDREGERGTYDAAIETFNNASHINSAEAFGKHQTDQKEGREQKKESPTSSATKQSPPSVADTTTAAEDPEITTNTVLPKHTPFFY